MKIGILSVPNNFHCQKWANALVNAGAEVVVISLERTNNQENLFESVHIPPFFKWNGRYRYPSYLASVSRLRKVIADHKIDLLHPLHVTPFGSWARMTGFQPTIMGAIGADILEYTQKTPFRSWDNIEGQTEDGFFQRLKRKYYKSEVQKSLHSANLITADNQTLVDAIVNDFGIHPNKVKLLRWGVDRDTFIFTSDEQVALCRKLNIPSDARIIISPRGAKAFYQTDVIIDSFSKTLEKKVSSHFYLVLASEYEIAQNILQQAEKLEQLAPNFRFIRQQLTRKEMAILWTMTDIFVSAPVYDGYSASVAEGRFAGAIPIVNDIPGNREVINHGVNGIIVQPFNENQITETLLTVIQNIPELKPLFEERNKKWINEHSLLENNAQDFLEISYKLLHRSFRNS